MWHIQSRSVRRRGRVRMLGLLIDGVLRVCDASIRPPQLAADNVAPPLQLTDGAADSVHTFLADGGQTAGVVVPLVGEGEHHRQQTLCLQGQAGILQMAVAHHSVVTGPLYSVNGHFITSILLSIYCLRVSPRPHKKRAGPADSAAVTAHRRAVRPQSRGRTFPPAWPSGPPDSATGSCHGP